MHPNDKAFLRHTVRAAFPGKAQRDAESRDICRHLAAWPPFREARVIAGYLPLLREADVRPLLEQVLAEKRILALPRCEDEAVMTFRQVLSLEDLVPGRWGFPEPLESAPVIEPEAVDLILVPLEAIDPAGMRLGKGGGYYDRWLPQTSAVAVGIALRHQRIEHVPCDSRDISLPFAADADGIHALS